MSQAGIINVIENNPNIPIFFDADTGTATALANTINILGSGGVTTSASGNTITIDATAAVGVLSVSGTANRITSTGGANPVIDIALNYVGQTSITTLGTITTGVWNGTAVGATFGGTGQTTYATGDILYASAANTLSKLAIGANGRVLTVTAGIPAWEVNAGGDVTGPGSSTDEALARFDGTTGKIIQNSVATMTDTGSITITSANSGAANELIMQNSSNTASSRAIITTRVGGSSASDAYFEASVDGVTDWAWGLDNSDSDAFVIANTGTLGTGNVMRVATSGEVTFPLQSAFSAYLGTTSTDATGDGTTLTVPFDTEIFDVNADFASNTYTCPATSKVQLNFSVLLQQATTAMSVNFILSTSNNSYNNNNQASMFAGNNQYNYSVLADMDAGDTAFVRVVVTGGAKVVDIFGTAADPRTQFNGYIAC